MATTEGENERLVQEFHRRVLTESDLDAAQELLAEDYVEHNPILPGGKVEGRENMVAFWADMFEGVPDLSITEEEVVATGNRVVTRHIGRGTHDGEFIGIDPTGNQFEIDGMDLYHIEDGKIAEAWVVMDTLGMMQQLGVVPEAPLPE